MSEINFDCPQCGQNLDAPEDMAGLFIECPACTKVIQVPKAGAPARAAPTQPVEDKTPATDLEKSTTVRIKLPPGLDIPQQPLRRIVIKRSRPTDE